MCRPSLVLIRWRGSFLWVRVLVCLRAQACGCVILGVSYIVIAPSVGAFPGKVFVMSVSPGDVVSTSVGVLHVQSVVQTVVMERSREVVSFAVSGVDGDGVGHVGVPVTGDEVPLAVDVSDSEALAWFDRERRLRRLGDAVFSPGAGFEVLGRLMPGRVALSLCDREPVDTVLGYLKDADDDLVAAHRWIKKKRMECLRAFEDFHAGWLKYQSNPWGVPSLGERCDVSPGIGFRSGGVYRFRREGAPVEDGYEYFKVVRTVGQPEIILYGASTNVSECQGFIRGAKYAPGYGYVVLLAEVGGEKLSMLAHTVKLLPIGSFKDIESYLELSEYEDVSLPGALRNIFLDMFAAGDGKPKCLPSREELNGGYYGWGDDYDKRCGELMEASADILFDIEKSVGYVRWLREQLVSFYRDELGFSI